MEYVDYYAEMLDRPVDDTFNPSFSSLSVRADNLTYLRDEFDSCWMWWRGDKRTGVHGTWVSNVERFVTSKGRLVREPNGLELRHYYRVGQAFGGIRPSKRKAVK